MGRQEHDNFRRILATPRYDIVPERRFQTDGYRHGTVMKDNGAIVPQFDAQIQGPRTVLQLLVQSAACGRCWCLGLCIRPRQTIGTKMIALYISRTGIVRHDKGGLGEGQIGMHGW